MSARLVAGMADYSYLNGTNPAQGRAPEGPEVSTAALEYGARGMPVFPCDPASKRPLVAGGFKKATTDGSIITTWWKQWPKAMIGIPTGEPSAVFVLDIDRDAAKGIDGFAALATMEAAHEPLPETRAQRTPRGGEHRLFARRPPQGPNADRPIRHKGAGLPTPRLRSPMNPRKSDGRRTVNETRRSTAQPSIWDNSSAPMRSTVLRSRARSLLRRWPRGSSPTTARKPSAAR